MPRESVTPRTEPFQVSVGWAQHQHMQVGVEHAEGRSIFWQLLGHDDDALAALGAAIRSADLRGYGATTSNTQIARDLLDVLDVECHGRTYTGLWSTLDRHDCNRLIRLLRKARDAAFGRDE